MVCLYQNRHTNLDLDTGKIKTLINERNKQIGKPSFGFCEAAGYIFLASSTNLLE